MVDSGKMWEKISIFESIKSQPNNFIMLNLIGTYECKADTKGRVMVPAPLKKQLMAVMAEGFVIKRAVFGASLEMYPMAEWNMIMKRVGGLNRFKRKNIDFIRKFTAGVKVVELDASGRLLIPKDLLEFAGISKDLVFASAINIIEIWDKDRYEHAINEGAEDFGDLAEEVMGFDMEEDGIS